MKNRSASIKAKILNLAKNENIDFQLIIIRYLHERLLYRLSISDFSHHLILKGGSFIYAIQGIKTRPTMDIDFLGHKIENNLETICEMFRSICTIKSDDEVKYRPESVIGEVITKQDKYDGIRIFIEAEFNSIRQRIQIDIGFGDVLTPASQKLEYPVLLNEMPVPILHAYSKETVIAEKFEAMIELSMANSRMKDFYDVYALLVEDNFDETILIDAICATFKNRETVYSENHALFSKEFALNSERQRNWAAFLTRINKDKHLTFDVVMKLITRKLLPYWERIKTL